MARGDVRLDHGYFAAKLKSGEIEALVNGAAEEIASNVRAQGIMVDGIPGKYALPVKVTPYTSDRAAASVAITHPAGKAVQAKHGALTKAASAAGLEVSGS